MLLLKYGAAQGFCRFGVLSGPFQTALNSASLTRSAILGADYFGPGRFKQRAGSVCNYKTRKSHRGLQAAYCIRSAMSPCALAWRRRCTQWIVILDIMPANMPRHTAKTSWRPRPAPPRRAAPRGAPRHLLPPCRSPLLGKFTIKSTIADCKLFSQSHCRALLYLLHLPHLLVQCAYCTPKYCYHPTTTLFRK